MPPTPADEPMGPREIVRGHTGLPPDSSRRFRALQVSRSFPSGIFGAHHPRVIERLVALISNEVNYFLDRPLDHDLALHLRHIHLMRVALTSRSSPTATAPPSAKRCTKGWQSTERVATCGFLIGCAEDDRTEGVSAFYGIVIFMYRPDHPPPHFHAQYGEDRTLGEPLKDPGYFRQVRVDDELRTIVWPNGLDPSPELPHGDRAPRPSRRSP